MIKIGKLLLFMIRMVLTLILLPIVYMLNTIYLMYIYIDNNEYFKTKFKEFNKNFVEDIVYNFNKCREI